MVTNGSTLNSISYTAPFFINLITLYFLIEFSGRALKPGEAFGLLWIFGVILTRPIRMLPILIIMGSDCYASTKKIENFLSLESEPNKLLNSENKKLDHFTSTSEKNSNTIEIEGLSFHHQNQALLKNINLTLKKGEFIAIIGEVGAGKSILFQALLGFLPVEFNAFNINGISVHTMSLNERRSIFAHVPQDPFVLNGTLRDNVTLSYNTPLLEDTKIFESLKLAQFDLAESQKELSLDISIGERGVNLSGGQKQRLSLARAHYHDRNILLLDDCLSAVDVKTEQKINTQLLNGAWKEKTRILITHRLSILEHCDRIIFMKQGAILENGTFQELLGRSAEFIKYIQKSKTDESQ